MVLINSIIRTRFIFWSLIFFTWLVPFVTLFYTSFISFDLAKFEEVGKFVFLDNYVDSLKREQFIESLLKTAFIILLSIPISLTLGFFIGYLIHLQNKPLSNILLYIFLLPMFIPPITSSLIWYFQFNPNYGPIGYLSNTYFEAFLLDSENAIYSIIGVEVWKLIPLYILISTTLFQSIPYSQRDTKSIYRITKTSYCLRLIWPSYSHIVFLGLTIGVIQVSKSLETVYIITRGGPGTATEVFPLYIYRLIFERYEFGIGGATAILYDFALIFIFFILLKRR